MVMVLWISSIFGFIFKLVIVPTAHVHRLVERTVCLVGSSVGWSDMLVGWSRLVCGLLLRFQTWKRWFVVPSSFVLPGTFLSFGVVSWGFGSGFVSKPYDQTFSNLPYATRFHDT